MSFILNIKIGTTPSTGMMPGNGVMIMGVN